MPDDGFPSSRPLFSGALGIGSRLPPANLEAEQALLGGLLANNKAYDRVGTFLQPHHFADAAHGLIYDAIRRRVEAGQLADAVTLRNEFDASGALADVGGGAYLAQLLGSMVGIVNVGEYGRLVRDCFLRREIINAAELAIHRAHGIEEGDEEGAEAIIEQLESELLDMGRNDVDPNVGSYDNASVVEEVMADLQRAISNPDVPMGIRTGLRLLDEKIGGLIDGKLYVIAGATSMGKTALAAKIMLSAAEQEKHADFVSCEMAPKEIMNRMAAMKSRQPLSVVEKGFISYPDGRTYRFPLSSPEMRAVTDALYEVRTMPGSWKDAAGPQLSSLVSRWRSLKRRGKLDLIILDYLQLVRVAGKNDADMRLRITEITSTLKMAAKQLQVPVVLLSQLKRGVEGRELRRPQLSDLKESGSIEADADVVLFPYREHYYLSRAKPTIKDKESAAEFAQREQEWKDRCTDAYGKAEIDIAKQRGGPTGVIPVAYIDHLTCFEDLDP